jgi:hypothetical protein
VTKKTKPDVIKPKSETKEKPEGYIFGRPTDYRPEFCQMLVDHMKQGFSFKSFGAIIDVCETTITSWASTHDDFLAAKTKGKSFERLYWEKLHNKCSDTGEGSASAIIWAQKNKFPDDYKDRNEPAQIQVNTNLNQLTVQQWDNTAQKRIVELEEKQKKLEQIKNLDVIDIL